MPKRRAPPKPKRTAQEEQRLRAFSEMMHSFKTVQIRSARVHVAQAIGRQRNDVSRILDSHKDINYITQSINHYFGSQVPKAIWKSALKQIRLDAGHATIALYHAFFTGKGYATYDPELDVITKEEEDFWGDEARRGTYDEWAPLPDFNFFESSEIVVHTWFGEVELKDVADVNDSWTNSVDNYLRNNGDGDIRITGIDQTTHDNIMGAIADGVDAGENINKISSRVEDQLDTTWPGRAETIARTEASAAMNQASLENAQATVPGMNKVWLCVFAENSREGHMEADGQSVAQDQPFVVYANAGDEEEELMFPGDPDGSAENVINCLCSVGYEEPTEAMPTSEDEAEASETEAEFPPEGETAQEVTPEQTEALSELFDQIAAGTGNLTSDEVSSISDALNSILGIGGEEAAAAPITDFDSAAEATSAWYDALSPEEQLVFDAYKSESLGAAEEDALNDVLNSSPKFKGTLYRGLHHAAFATEVQNAKQGDLISFANVTSTTASELMGTLLMDAEAEAPVLLTITGGVGTAVAGEESEVLMGANAISHVVTISQNFTKEGLPYTQALLEPVAEAPAKTLKGGPGSGDFGHGPQGGGLVGGAGEGAEGGKADEANPLAREEKPKEQETSPYRNLLPEYNAPQGASSKVSSDYQTARQNFQEYIMDHPEQVDARDDWIQGYKEYQAFFRDEDHVDSHTWYSIGKYPEEASGKTAVLNELVEHWPQYEGVAYRGIATSKDEYEAYKSLGVGGEIHDKGFMAATTDMGFVKEWTDYSTHQRAEDYLSEGAYHVVVQVDNAKGAAIDKLATNRGTERETQNEVLMKPGTTLRITGKPREEKEEREIMGGKYPVYTLYVSAKMVR